MKFEVDDTKICNELYNNQSESNNDDIQLNVATTNTSVFYLF